MKNVIMDVETASRKIAQGETLLIAGSERALSELPCGNWIGGTSVYFLTEEGGRCDQENLFVTGLSPEARIRVRHYGTDCLKDLALDRFEHGYSNILIPAFCKAHTQFAIEAATYPGLFDQPLYGWITGTHLEDVGHVTPKVVDGTTGIIHEEGALLMHVELPNTHNAELEIVNVFEPDPDGDKITFEQDGFTAEEAVINGRRMNFAEYVAQSGFDSQLPLVADYAGALVNVAIHEVNQTTGKATFYGPVTRGVTYRPAKPMHAYTQAFAAMAPPEGRHAVSCNCILNYLYSQLEGETTGSYTGPATFGEIAYILLNQTMVHMRLQREIASKVA